MIIEKIFVGILKTQSRTYRGNLNPHTLKSMKAHKIYKFH